jgi:acyl carrier protein
MNPESAELRETIDRLRPLIVSSLLLDDVSPEHIDPDEPLFGGGLGLDSVDALELVLAVEKEFHIQLDDAEARKEAFGSVRKLAQFVTARLSEAR